MVVDDTLQMKKDIAYLSIAEVKTVEALKIGFMLKVNYFMLSVKALLGKS